MFFLSYRRTGKNATSFLFCNIESLVDKTDVDKTDVNETNAAASMEDDADHSENVE